MDITSFVQHEMEKHVGRSLAGKTRVLISCPFHDDKTPSMAVTLVKGKGSPGQYMCFACKASSSTHGGWDGLASVLNLASMDKDAYEAEYHGRSRDLSKLTTAEKTIDDLYEEWGFQPAELYKGYSWRGIDYRTLKRVRAVPGRDGFGVSCTLFPLWVNGELVGGIKAKNRPQKKDPRKYLNASGEWSRTVGLFPLHARKTWPTVVLVEGPRDALTLHQFGIPALSILGTLSWSDAKRDLLLASGVQRVLLAFDGDKAGRQGAEVIMDSLRGLVPRARIKLPEDEDPGSLPKSFWERKTPSLLRD